MLCVRAPVVHQRDDDSNHSNQHGDGEALLRSSFAKFAKPLIGYYLYGI